MIAHGTYRPLLKGKTIQDRSLGYAEAHVNEPTVEANQSAGKRIEATNLKFEKIKGNTLGHGSLALKNFKFNVGGNRI